MALSEYKFVGHPLQRIADRTDYVCVELTFHKTLPTLPIYKKRAESSRQPAPLLASGLATAARRPPDQQPTPARRPTPCVKEETPPPCRGGSNEYPQSMFWAEMWKIYAFLSENFRFLVVKFSVYLNRLAFIMIESSKDYNYFKIQDPDWYPLHEKY